MITKKIISCCVILVSLCMSATYAAENSIIETCVTPFFNALKSGDVATVEQHIADPLYSEINARLNSQEYPEFLRTYYSGSYIEIIDIYDFSNEQKNVNLDLYFSSNEKQSIELELLKSATGEWKITKQTEITE